MGDIYIQYLTRKNSNVIYCGWKQIIMNLCDYVTCKGKVNNIHIVN